jgi:type II secretory ATPase GspE/PulE/Tfp pilus assembly ATPase PilB-like protein
MPHQSAARNLIGRAKAYELGVLPSDFDAKTRTLTVQYAGSDPAIRQQLHVHTGSRWKIEIQAATPAAVQQGLRDLFGPQKEAASVPETIETWNEIAQRSADLNAQNIRLKPTLAGGTVVLEVEGQMLLDRELDRDRFEELISYIAIRSFSDFNRQIGQRGEIDNDVDGRDLHFRVSSYPTFLKQDTGRVYLMLRTLRSIDTLPPIDLDPDQRDLILNEIRRDGACVVLGAPPGVGKTTLAHWVIDQLDLANTAAYSIEDPPEIVNPRLVQSEIKPQVGWGYLEALTEVLRQQPKFVFLGEMLDTAIAERAMGAAPAGIPLMTTAQATHALAIIARLRALRLDPLTITQALTMMVSQRLVHILCGDCRQAAQPSEGLRKMAQRQSIEVAGAEVYERGLGCESCLHRGTIGQTGIFEIVPITADIKIAILANDDPAMAKTARTEGFVTLAERALRLIMDGKVDQRVLEQLPRTDVDALKITNEPFNALLEESVRSARTRGQERRRHNTALRIVEPQ